MAKAEKTPEVVETREVVVQEAGITLSLTMQEAEALRSLTGYVHLSKSDFAEESSAVYDALSKILRGYAKHRPTALVGNAVVWSEK